MTTRRDEVYLMGSVPAAAWESEEPSLPLPREDFIAAFAGFHAEIRCVVEAAVDVTVMPICDRERRDCWSGERIVLLGDACHPVRPYMAAGGAMAIEDAAILSRCLATIGEGDPAEAFRCYEATRIPRVGRVQQISIDNSWLRGATDTDWFFCYDACTAPLTRPT
jgi:6-hydroxynicotinate 3-monooxygenase